MTPMKFLTLALLTTPLLAGCGDDTTPTDSGVTDSGGGDSTVADSGDSDGAVEDGGPADAGDAGDAGGTETITVEFAAKVGAEAFSCGGSFADVGTTNSTVVTNDFRFYVHDVRLVSASGTEVPLTIADDGMWALDGTVLLDFEDGSGTCTGGNSALHSSITGTVPAGTYTGLRFTMGVPFAQNHNIDVATAMPPLNVTSMFWNWQGGYKFLRIDGTSTGITDGWRQHLGSTGCDGDPTGGVTACTNTNSVAVAFDDFDPETDTVVADLALLLQDTDIDTNTADTPPGCMATMTDPDCAGVFKNLGLDHMGVAGVAQTFFRME